VMMAAEIFILDLDPGTKPLRERVLERWVVGGQSAGSGDKPPRETGHDTDASEGEQRLDEQIGKYIAVSFRLQKIYHDKLRQRKEMSPGDLKDLKKLFHVCEELDMNATVVEMKTVLSGHLFSSGLDNSGPGAVEGVLNKFAEFVEKVRLLRELVTKLYYAELGMKGFRIAGLEELESCGEKLTRYLSEQSFLRYQFACELREMAPGLAERLFPRQEGVADEHDQA
jgi:hypothetical protein